AGSGVGGGCVVDWVFYSAWYGGFIPDLWDLFVILSGVSSADSVVSFCEVWGFFVWGVFVCVSDSAVDHVWVGTDGGAHGVVFIGAALLAFGGGFELALGGEVVFAARATEGDGARREI